MLQLQVRIPTLFQNMLYVSSGKYPMFDKSYEKSEIYNLWSHHPNIIIKSKIREV